MCFNWCEPQSVMLCKRPANARVDGPRGTQAGTEEKKNWFWEPEPTNSLVSRNLRVRMFGLPRPLRFVQLSQHQAHFRVAALEPPPGDETNIVVANFLDQESFSTDMKPPSRGGSAPPLLASPASSCPSRGRSTPRPSAAQSGPSSAPPPSPRWSCPRRRTASSSPPSSSSPCPSPRPARRQIKKGNVDKSVDSLIAVWEDLESSWGKVRA